MKLLNRLKGWVSVGATVAVMAGCAAVTTPPPVSPQMVSLGTKTGASKAELERGKTILTSKCIGCHSLYPVESRSHQEWREVVDAMAPKARLQSEEKRQLLAYLLTAREVTP